MTNTLQDVMRIVLGAFMIYASIAHFTFRRKDFQAQVPDWLPISKDFVVIASGIVEVLLGVAMIFALPDKATAGLGLAVFYVLIFPGNINQYVHHKNAFGLNTDRKRLIRLFFQPVLILWALWSTNAFILI